MLGSDRHFNPNPYP